MRMLWYPTKRNNFIVGVGAWKSRQQTLIPGILLGVIVLMTVLRADVGSDSTDVPMDC